jgi:four helix bundle protein
VVREPAKTFRDLLVWLKAHQLALAVYRMTSGFPKQETYGLTCQMQRASVSVAANIAEGFKRRGPDLGYADTKQQMIVLEEVSRFLEAYSHGILTSSTS